MARTGICGFEANDVATAFLENVDGSTASAFITSDTGVFRSGSRSLKVVAQSGATTFYNLTTRISFAGYNRVYIRVTTLPASQRAIIGSTGTGVALYLNSDGTIAYKNGAATIGTSTAALTDTSAWYRVEWRVADGTSVTVLQIDGNSEVTGSPSSWTCVAIVGAHNSVANTYTAYFDDLVCDNAAFPGASNVALLLPTGDNTRTNWTAGAGGTSSLFEAVNNTPPTAVASASETDTTNIESNSNTGTATYIATMATYASAGIGASDTINAIESFILHGEDISTGTKTGTLELTQNPVVGSSAFNFGDDSGAHAAYGASGNQWHAKAILTASPSVTVATAPLMKLVKTDTTTRVGCVCFMGIYVEYVPAVAGTTVKTLAAMGVG